MLDWLVRLLVKRREYLAQKGAKETPRFGLRRVFFFAFSIFITTHIIPIIIVHVSFFSLLFCACAECR